MVSWRVGRLGLVSMLYDSYPHLYAPEVAYVKSMEIWEAWNGVAGPFLIISFESLTSPACMSPGFLYTSDM